VNIQENGPETLVDPLPTEETPKEKEPKEHISLGSDSEGDTEDGGMESSSSQATPLKTSKGWKSKKKKREEATYLDVLQGSQKTLKGMMNTRSTKKNGPAQKGAASSQGK
jgi:hypothetical protein